MAMMFNGTQYLSIASNAAFNFSPSVTIMAWMNTTTNGFLVNQQRIVSRNLSGALGNEQYSLSLLNGVPQFMIGTTAQVTTLAAGITVAVNTWYHVCGTYDGATMRVYVNGVQTATVARSGTITSSTGLFTVGCDATSATAREAYFTGRIEEVRLYNRTLTANEIMTIYMCKGTHMIRNGLVLCLNMDENRTGMSVAASSVVYDTGPNKLNATNAIAGATFVDGMLRKRKIL